MMLRKPWLLVAVAALAAVVSTVVYAGGKTVVIVLLLIILLIGLNGDLKVAVDPQTQPLEGKMSISPKKQTFRGKVAGEMVNESGEKGKFEDHPLVEEALEDAAGEAYDVTGSLLKVSVKGKVRGKFAGTFEAF